jgi:predicted Rdx family selenoprotein
VLPDDYDLPVFEGATVDFVIHYDPVEEEAALLLARRLFAELDLRIESMTLIPLAGSDFDLWLDGELVHSTRAAGREPSALQAARLAREILEREENSRSTDTFGPDHP